MSTRRYFRGVNAPASLKQRSSRPFFSGFPYFRGVNAPASLKLLRWKGPLAEARVISGV